MKLACRKQVPEMHNTSCNCVQGNIEYEEAKCLKILIYMYNLHSYRK